MFPLFATGVVDTGGKFATSINDSSSTGAKFTDSVIDTLAYEFLKKFEMALRLFSGARGKMIHKKTLSKKSLDTVPLSTSKFNNIVSLQKSGPR